MGQKVNPVGFRLKIVRDWDARWFSEKEYTDLLHEDITVRRYIKKRLFNSGIARVEIERKANRVFVTIHTARPGMVIGKGGAGIDELQSTIAKMTNKQVKISIAEVKVPELSATLVAENVAAQIERRISFRRAMKQSVTKTLRMGALGIKISCSGRLGGAEMARTEWYREGRVPLHTLRADIDYGTAEAHTTYGRIGIKVWIYRGEVLREAKKVNKPEVEGSKGGE